MNVSGATSSLDVVRRCDDGSDESIASPLTAEKAVLQDIGCLEIIPKMKLKAALKKEEEWDDSHFCKLRQCHLL